MSTIQEAIKSVQNYGDNFTKALERHRGFLGDGDGTVYVAERDGYVYVRHRQAESADITGTMEPEEVIYSRSDIPPIEGYPVIFGRDIDTEDFQLLATDTKQLLGWIFDKYIKDHHEQHEFNEYDTVWIQKQAILPLLVHPTSPASTLVQVYSGWYQWDTDWHYFETTTSTELSSHVPVQSGKARFLLICIDGESETLHYEPGDTFITFLPPRDCEDRIPPPPEGKIPLAAIYLPYGTTSFDWDIIYDVRLLFSGGGSMSTGSAPRDAAYVTMAYNDILSAERLLSAGNGIVVTDNGPDDTVVVSLDDHDHAGDVSGDGGIIPGTSVELPEVPVAMYDDVTDWFNTTQSAGRLSGGAVTPHAYPITGVTVGGAGAGEFKIDGDHTAAFPAGVILTVSGSTNNDGDYTVSAGGATHAGGTTTIPVDEAVGAVADGNIAAGTVDVALGTGLIKVADADLAATKYFDWAATTTPLIPTNDVSNWVYLDYNGGSPIIGITDDHSIITRNNIFVLDRLWRDDSELHIIGKGQNAYNLSMRTHRNLVRIFHFQRGNGLKLTESGVRKVDVTAGNMYRGLNEIPTNHIDTDNGDSFTTLYRDGGGDWTWVTGQTTIDNANYDDGTGVLEPITNNQYGVYWVYMDYDSHLHVQYGQDSYHLGEAEVTQPPATATFLSRFSMLIAKITVKEGGAENFYGVEYPWDTVFVGAPVAVHNNLGGLQGGSDPDEYYHMSAATYASCSGGCGGVLPNVAAEGYALVSTGVNTWGADLTPLWKGRHSFEDGITFAGGAGVNSIVIPDGLADAFDITNGVEFLRLNTDDDYFLIDPGATGVNVGIGLPAPLAPLHIQQADISLGLASLMANTSLVFEGTDGNVELVGKDDGTWCAALALTELDGAGDLNDKWAFLRQTTTAGDGSLNISYGANFNPWANSMLVTILPSGEFGINERAPTGHLDIASGIMTLVVGADEGLITRTNVTRKFGRVGGFHYTNAQEPVGLIVYDSNVSASIVSIGGGSGSVNAATEIKFWTAVNTVTTTGTLRMTVDSAGAMQWHAYGVGALTSDAAGNITAVSDMRLKRKVRNTEIGLAEVLQMQGKAWHYTKESGLDTKHEYLGFIADDIEKIVPGAVGQMSDGMRTLDPNALLPAFVDAFKEIDARLTQLEVA